MTEPPATRTPAALRPGSVSLRLYPHLDLPAEQIVTELLDQGRLGEDVGFDARSTAAGLRQLFSEGLRVSPGLADATFREVRVGLRPVSDDDFPILGPLPDATTVHVATGHGANGLLLGPVSGRLVADAIAGRASAVDLTPFSPARIAPA